MPRSRSRRPGPRSRASKCGRSSSTSTSRRGTMPKYLLMFINNDEAWESQPKAQMEAKYKEIRVWWDANVKAGRIVGGEELAPRTTATTVRFTPKGPTVTDGTYMEAKELIGGYALIDVSDLDAAIAFAKGWPVGSTV